MSLEIISLAEIKQALRGIKRPFFSKWVYFAKNKGFLDPIIDGLLQAKKVEKVENAIIYLSKILPDEVLENPKKINFGDFQNSSTSNHLVKKLIEEIEKKPRQSGFMDKTTRYGSFGHSMASRLFSGELIPDNVFVNGDYKSNQTVQSDLFPNGYQYELLNQQYSDIYKKKNHRRLLGKLIEKIEKDWKELVRIWSNGYPPMQTEKFKSLTKDLQLIYKDHVLKVFGEGIEDEYLAYLTLMTWVTVLLYYKEVGNFPLFNEVSILENSSDIGVGRLDILSVVTIDGHTPTQEESNQIRRLSKRPFPSVGHVIQALVSTFGTHLHLKITDWKFAVGDGISGMKKQLNIIRKEDVAIAPLKKHKDQLERYLSLTVLSHSLASGFSKLEEIEKLWETENFSLSGELVYFFPDNLPRVHPISLTKEDVKNVFRDQIVSNFNLAKKRNMLRITSNIVLSHVLQVLKSGEAQREMPANLANEIFLEDQHQYKKDITVSAIVMEHYEPIFKDPPTNTIEIVGKKGNKEVLEMHVDRIFAGINSRSISAEQGFNRKIGGKICCPVHGEKTPSMSLAFDIGRFTCFGCGIRGEFNTASIPDDIEIHSGKFIRWELEHLVIPPRHREIMACAQDILHRSFKGSPGEVYLATERGLNPDISYSFLEAGYGDQRLIEGLLESKFTLDELIYYGLFGLSKSKNAHAGSAISVLKRFGYSGLESMKRLTDDGESYGLPYSILEGRITYPLEIHKVVNSIYGRSIDPNCPKPLRHRKTKTKANGMKHGGINISWAVESKAQYKVVLEAGLNMATMIQMANDIKVDTAIVGANNLLLIEFLAKTSGDIISALDFDPPKYNEVKAKWEGETGQRNTVLLRDRLVEYGFKGNVYDFTGGFVKNNPGINYNDPNQYWVDCGQRINILDHIQEIPEVYTHSMEKS
jgi:hypothetical protein